MQSACKYGDLKVAKWLVEKFELNADDARSYNNCALKWAYNEVHLEVVEWLVKTFNLDEKDAISSDGYIPPI